MTHAIVRTWTAPRGGALSTFYLRLVGALALIGIVVVLVLPQFADLVPYVVLAIWFNGPQSPVVPAGFEPVLLLYGQFYSPWVIAALGTAGNVVAEAINYELFALAAQQKALRRLHDSRVVVWLKRMFGKAPFVAVAVCAAAFPFWIARVLVVLARYPIGWHLTATAVGRFPRFWVLAALGATIGIPAKWLAALVGVSLLATAIILIVRSMRSLTTSKA